MDIQQIAIFLTLIDTKSFTETAEQLYMSQPSASKQIKALEEELRVHLFRRRGRSVELTEAGSRFEVCARHIYAEYRNAKDIASGLSQNSRPRLVVGSELGPTVYKVTGAVDAFREKHPEAEIVLKIRSSSEIGRLPENNGAHVFIFWTNDFLDSKYEKTSVLEEEIVLVIPADHPLAKEEKITIQMLKGQPFAIHVRDTFRPAFESCLQSGFEPVICYDACTTDAVLSLVSEGRALSFSASERAYAWDGPPITIKKLGLWKAPILKISILKAETNELAWEFYQFYKDYVKACGFQHAKLLI